MGYIDMLKKCISCFIVLYVFLFMSQVFVFADVSDDIDVTFVYDKYDADDIDDDIVIENAVTLSNAAFARIQYASELASAYRSYVSENSFITIHKIVTDQMEYYLTHVIINDPSQIRAGLSNDTYGGARECPSSASVRLGWTVGVNGSNFDYKTGGNDLSMGRVVIKHGNVITGKTALGSEICLDRYGSLSVAETGEHVSSLLARGVTDTFICGDTLLIDHGQKVNIGIESMQYRYPRTAIGMVAPCDYYLITAGDAGTYSKGATYDDIRDILWEHGCTFGKCMDGGGSSSLVFCNELVNVPACLVERPVCDFLYFTDEVVPMIFID